jgi:hypothetical protein
MWRFTGVRRQLVPVRQFGREIPRMWASRSRFWWCARSLMTSRRGRSHSFPEHSVVGRVPAVIL